MGGVKKEKAVRPRIPLSIRDMDTRPIAEAYNKIISKAPHSIFARKILKLGVREGKTLDIACGPGHLLISLSKFAPKLELHGLDISPNMLKIAEENLERKELGKKIKLYLGSAYDMPFEDSTFDLVVNTNTLHCLENPKKFFDEFIRVMKPGGAGLILAYSRDTSRWLRSLGYLNTRYLAWRKIPLDGMGPLIDASYTSEEIESYLKQCPLTKWQIKKSIFLMTILLQK
ncbi:MAG: hypothetical protein COT21_02135 [Hadesarchaea archaeon CG08_land_8_20_14_0_20_51_8]|nr:MAG: hypothetical protein COT21_02135 [Hadesarchaea archaeon CG08_land_8_20_14_0_20_51_8]